MVEGFRDVRKRLEPAEAGDTASDRAAQAVLEMVGNHQGEQGTGVSTLP